MSDRQKGLSKGIEEDLVLGVPVHLGQGTYPARAFKEEWQ